MPSYRFTHLSDLHCTDVKGLKPWQFLNKRAIGYMNWRYKRKNCHRPEVLSSIIEHMHRLNPDHILCTGDLTNLGTYQEQLQAVEWLHQLGRPDNVSLVMGNHDAYVMGNAKAGHMLWRKWMQGDVKQENHDDVFPYIHNIPLDEKHQIILLKVNTAVATLPFSARGRVGDVQRARLKALLQHYAAPHYFKLIMLHHPPLTGITSPHRSLQDGDDLKDIIENNPPHLIIHGHNHKHQITMLNTAQHAVPIVGVRSASICHNHPRYEAAGFNRYEITLSPQTQWHLKADFLTYTPSDNELTSFHEQEIWSFPLV